MLLFIKISSPNLQGMFKAMKNVCAKFWPHFEKNGCHCQLFENHKDALNLEILQLASLHLHKRYMARKACLIVILV